MAIYTMKPKRWNVGRLTIIRHPLYRETLIGVIFVHEHGSRRSVEVMTGKHTYVFYVVPE